jgi:hypothetical protein
MAEPLTFPDAGVGATDDCLDFALSMQEEEFKPCLDEIWDDVTELQGPRVDEERNPQQC